MKLSTSIALILCCILLTACPNKDDETGGTDSPESFDKLEVSLYDGGGMLPISERIYISNDSAYWSFDQYNNEVIIKWKPTEEEIKKLWTVFQENDFTKIESEDRGEVFDRGGISLNIRVDDLEARIENSGSYFIKDECRSHYKSIVNEIKDYANTKVKEQLIPVKLKPAKHLISSNQPLRLSFNNELIYEPNNESLSTKETQLDAYPGPNRIDITFYYKDSTTNYGGLVSMASDMYFEEINISSQEIHLDLQDNKIILEVK